MQGDAYLGANRVGLQWAIGNGQFLDLRLVVHGDDRRRVIAHCSLPIALRTADVMSTRRAQLLHLLTSYSPADPDEQRYRVEMLDLAAVAHDPFDRHEYTPGHFTASAFVIHPKGDRVLMIHHGKIGIWVQPGGHVDPDDAGLLAAAAGR